VIEVGSHLVALLVVGIDHRAVGSGEWYSMILNSAPVIEHDPPEHHTPTSLLGPLDDEE
jgi:hypothetical protein